MSPASPYANSAPIIDALTASATTTLPNGNVNLGAQAHDPDAADALTYAWSTSCGTFASSHAPTTVWTAPDRLGACQVTLTVDDGRGASVSSSIALLVDPGSHGGAIVKVAPDRSPVIKGISVTPTPLVKGQPVTLNLDVTEPDGEVLTYKWTSDCAGTFADDTQQNAGFTLSALPATGHCQFQVDVADPLGAHTIGVLNQNTGTVEVDQAPVIEAASQSNDELGPGESALLTVRASDPDGQEVSFSWTAAAGSVTALSSDAHSTSLRFTAPAVLPEGALRVEVAVTDAGGQIVKVVFGFSRPNRVPVIDSTTITPSPLTLGNPAVLDVVAADSDGDGLGYAWTTSCDGTFVDAASARPTFTLTSFPAGYYCSFEVVVTDGRGGRAVGTVLSMADHLPVVGTPTLSEVEIMVGLPVGLAVSATDPDDDSLSYAWSRSCEGTFDDRSLRNPTFTLSVAPGSGHCSFTITVTDARGGQSMATVDGLVESAPDITDMQITPLPLLAGQPTQLSVAASDADGDPLTYAWASDCVGTFAGETSPTPTFSLTEVPANHLCTFQVRVSDGRGGASLGQLSGQAGAVVVNLAPTIQAYAQGWVTVAPGDRVPLHVWASDPEGQPVSYAWTATDGTLDTPVTQADTSSSSVIWTAPSGLPGQTMHVTVVVADPTGLSASVTLDFTAGPT
jgi:hypothetical protein